VKLRVTDVNGQVTDENYDGFGRASAVWIPGHAKAANATQPNDTFDDHLFGTLPKRVTSGQPQNILSTNAYTHTATLREDGSYADSYAILDGYGESVQTQAVTADNSTGRVITDTAYDTLGRVIETVPGFPASGAPSSTWTNWPVSPPSVSTTTYDGQDRPLVASVYATDPTGKRTPVSTTTKSYTGTDRVDTTPPTGGTATTTISDARGRSSQLWQYNASPTPTGNHDVTIYGYGYTRDPLLGAQATKTVTDPASNVWTTISDLLGRAVSSQDPDAGTTVSAYDDAGDLLGTADGSGQVVAYDYGTASSDPLRRKAGEYNGGVIAGYPGLSAAAKSSALSTALGSAITAAHRLTTYTYDKSVAGAAIPNGRGQLTASSRYTAAAAGPYTTGVVPSLGYDPTGKPLGTFTTIPSGDGNGALAGTYNTINYYTPLTGLLDHTDLPSSDGAAKAGFAPETVYNTYNVNGLLLSSGGNADYVVDTTYNQLSQQLTRTLGDYPYQLVQSQQYDPVTARVTKTFLDGNAGSATNGALNQYGVDYDTYTYDAAGLVTGVNDLQNANVSGSYNPGAQTTDLQCYTYDAEGRLTAAWTDNGGTTPSATPVLNDPSGSGPAPGGVGSCKNAAPTTAAAGKAQTQGDPAPYWETFALDAAGDRQSMTDHDVTSGTTAGDTTRGYIYKNPSGGQPNTLTSVTNTTGTVNKPDAYTYDSSGRTLTRNVTSGAPTVNQSLGWDAEGRLASVTDTTTNKTASYVYDAAGTELLRRDPANDQTSLYLAGLELHLKISANTVTGNRYYSFAGAPAITADQIGKITYEAGTSQGTALTTIDAATGKITARRYQTPYGTPRGAAAASWPDDHTFLGKSADSTTGLIDVGAREYDPATGRFISADPVFQPDNPQTIGGYAYAGNDPVSSSDPTGQRPESLSDARDDSSNPCAGLTGPAKGNCVRDMLSNDNDGGDSGGDNASSSDSNGGSNSSSSGLFSTNCSGWECTNANRGVIFSSTLVGGSSVFRNLGQFRAANHIVRLSDGDLPPTAAPVPDGDLVFSSGSPDLAYYGLLNNMEGDQSTLLTQLRLNTLAGANDLAEPGKLGSLQGNLGAIFSVGGGGISAWGEWNQTNHNVKKTVEVGVSDTAVNAGSAVVGEAAGGGISAALGAEEGAVVGAWGGPIGVGAGALIGAGLAWVGGNVINNMINSPAKQEQIDMEPGWGESI
jgi:RHS repeat-associated protein